MPVGLNRISIYTVKFMGKSGLEFKDLQADGTGDAKDKFAREYPDAQVITIYRKQ